jgi:hypothetical protein
MKPGELAWEFLESFAVRGPCRRLGAEALGCESTLTGALLKHLERAWCERSVSRVGLHHSKPQLKTENIGRSECLKVYFTTCATAGAL